MNTKHFGNIDIDENGIIDFPEGIPGFEGMRRFALLAGQESDTPFKWLQCVDDGDLAFVAIDPKTVIPDYLVDVDDSEVEVLKIGNTDRVVVLSIVVIPDEITKMTANLKAPILINTENNLGKQVTIENGKYSIRHPVFDKLRRMGGDE